MRSSIVCVLATFYLLFAATSAWADDPTCAELCTEVGACDLRDDGYCVATTDAHCAASALCATKGKCGVGRDGRCEATDESMCGSETTACREHGRCVWDSLGRRCTATDASCAASTACDSRGLCGAGEFGECVPRNEAECQKSPDCAAYGTCAWSDEMAGCVATTDGCVDSDWCEETGNCGVVNGTCAPRNARDCKRSTLCKESNYCTYWAAEEIEGFSRAICGPSNDEDCAESQMCEDERKCVYRAPGGGVIFPVPRCIAAENDPEIARQPPQVIAVLVAGSSSADGGRLDELTLDRFDVASAGSTLDTPSTDRPPPARRFHLEVEVESGACDADEVTSRLERPLTACLTDLADDARPRSEGAFQVRIGPKRTRVHSAPKADDWDGARACVEAALEAAAIEGGRCTLRVSARPMGGL